MKYGYIVKVEGHIHLVVPTDNPAKALEVGLREYAKVASNPLTNPYVEMKPVQMAK